MIVFSYRKHKCLLTLFFTVLPSAFFPLPSFHRYDKYLTGFYITPDYETSFTVTQLRLLALET